MKGKGNGERNAEKDKREKESNGRKAMKGM